MVLSLMPSDRRFGLETRQLLRLFAPICHSSKVKPTKNNGVMLKMNMPDYNRPGSVKIPKTKRLEKQ
jgi:hypothetical protein